MAAENVRSDPRKARNTEIRKRVKIDKKIPPTCSTQRKVFGMDEKNDMSDKIKPNYL